MKFGCAAIAFDFRWVTPKKNPWSLPRELILRWLGGCVGTPAERSVPTRLPKALGWRIGISLDMQVRAKLLQRTLRDGGNRGLLWWNGKARRFTAHGYLLWTSDGR